MGYKIHNKNQSHGWLHGCLRWRLHGRFNGCLHGWLHGWMHKCLHGCLQGCIEAAEISVQPSMQPFAQCIHVQSFRYYFGGRRREGVRDRIRVRIRGRIRDRSRRRIRGRYISDIYWFPNSNRFALNSLVVCRIYGMRDNISHVTVEALGVILVVTVRYVLLFTYNNVIFFYKTL